MEYRVFGVWMPREGDFQGANVELIATFEAPSDEIAIKWIRRLFSIDTELANGLSPNGDLRLERKEGSQFQLIYAYGR